MVNKKVIISVGIVILFGILYLSRNVDIGIADNSAPSENMSVATGSISGGGYGCDIYLQPHRVGKDLQPLNLIVCQKEK